MNDTTFNVNNMVQTIKVTPNDISSNHDAINRYLNIYLSFTFRNLNAEWNFDILPIGAQLKFQAPVVLLSETTLSNCISATSLESTNGQTFNFKLSETALHYIEEHREGNILLSLELRLQILLKNRLPNMSGLVFYGQSHIHNELVKINFAIPKSIWVEKILPESGYRNLRLIEIPLSHEYLKEAYDDIISEFDKAEKYFNSHDYNKCVAHCRSTLDALTRNLRAIKKESKSESGFEWLKTVATETFTWIDQLNKSTSAITSKSHHAGQNKDFQRFEAESIYMITLGLLNYIGNLKT